MASGHVRKRGKNSFQIVIELDKDEYGNRQRIYQSVKTTRAREAKDIMIQMIAEIENGTYVEPTKIKVKDYLLSWLKSKKPDIAERTYESYEMILRVHLIPYFGHMDICKLQNNPLVIENYKNEKLETLSNRTVHYHLSILGQALSAAVDLRIIRVNPVASIKKPRVQRPPVGFLTVEQADHLLLVAKKYREYPPIFVDYNTGLRLGELLGVTWPNVEIKTVKGKKKGKIKVRKQLQYIKGEGLRLMDILKTSSSYRDVSISESVIEVIESLPKLSEYVFCIPDGPHAGKPYDPTNFDNAFKEIAKEAGFENISMHSLRHTHISHLLMAGVPVNKVQKRAGHERASTTLDIYGHVIPEKDDNVPDILERYQQKNKPSGRQTDGKTEETETKGKKLQRLYRIK